MRTLTRCIYSAGSRLDYASEIGVGAGNKNFRKIITMLCYSVKG
jgi:hypothetical protein